MNRDPCFQTGKKGDSHEIHICFMYLYRLQAVSLQGCHAKERRQGMIKAEVEAGAQGAQDNKNICSKTDCSEEETRQ